MLQDGKPDFVTSIIQSPGVGTRQVWLWVCMALGVYWAALIYQLGAQWSVYEQYSYGWAVPFLCAFLAWQRIEGSKAGREKLGVAGRETIFQIPTSIFYTTLAVSALLYAPTRFFQEANPIWRLTSWLWALETIVITLVLLRLAIQSSGGCRSHTGLRISNFVFPICFFLVAVPWPSGIEAFVVNTLTRLNVSATVEVLGGLGIPALQHGNVIEVATGNVGINEACSGIRSFQATLMISLFFGEFYRLAIKRRAACVVIGLCLAFLFNIVRTTLLTYVAAKKGVGAIAVWHDPAGVTILVACFVSLWLASMWLARATHEAVATQIPPAENENHKSGNSIAVFETAGDGRSTVVVRNLAIGLLAWFVLVEAGTQFWYHAHENTTALRKEWNISLNQSNPTLSKVQIPAAISIQFRADSDVEAHWQDAAGNSWQLYYFRWNPGHSLAKRVVIQISKTHGPEKCLPAIGMTMKSDLGVVSVPANGIRIAFHQYVFSTDDRLLNVFYGIYEDPTGSDVLANRRKNTASRIAAAIAGSRNYGQRFLEIAVEGPQNPDEARDDLQHQLQKIITVENQ